VVGGEVDVPVLMLRAVRAKAAVAGMPPTMPVTMLAIPRPNTSLRWLKVVLVMVSAILAEMRVSSRATNEIDSADERKSMVM
jgi:hypothetical protein